MIGHKIEEMIAHGGLGMVCESLSEMQKANHEKALPIAKEIGNRQVEGRINECLGTVFGSLGEYQKAKQNYDKGLLLR